jgi:hypothetical protein
MITRIPIKFSVINAYSPPRDDSLRDKLIFIIPNDRYASLLRHLNRAYPLAVRYRIDYPSVQEFEDLFCR